MSAGVIHQPRVASSHTAPAILSVREFGQDAPRVSIPRPEVLLIARLGAPVAGGLDVHVLGPRETVRRKWIQGGIRYVVARLRIEASAQVLGVPADEVAGRVVPLDEVWGDGPTQALCERLAQACDVWKASATLHRAIAERMVVDRSERGNAYLAAQAADRLTSARVSDVASDLNVSERHLRRVFREVVGLSPKTFSRLARFRRAVRAAQEEQGENWAHIAADVGYYDQAHLIEEFHAIAGMAPGAFLDELEAADLDWASSLAFRPAAETAA
jgi:AraC-like DNA-binding protein